MYFSPRSAEKGGIRNLNGIAQKDHLERGTKLNLLEFLSSAVRKRHLQIIIKVKIIYKYDIVDNLTVFLRDIPECQNIFNRFVRIILEDGTSGGVMIKNYCSACLADGRPIIIVSNHHLCSRDLEAVDIYSHQSKERTYFC